MATISDAPKQFRMSDFLGSANLFGGYQKGSRFAVRIMPQGNLLTSTPGFSAWSRELMYLCEITDLPGRSFDDYVIRYYGPFQSFPSQVRYGESIDFTFICRNGGAEREFFDNWMSLICPQNTNDIAYLDDYKCEIDIFQFSEVGVNVGSQGFAPIGGGLSVNVPEKQEPVANYKLTLIDAWPSTMSSQPLVWSDENFLRLVVTFSYPKWIRKGIDPDARTGANGYSYKLISKDGIQTNPRVR